MEQRLQDFVQKLNMMNVSTDLLIRKLINKFAVVIEYDNNDLVITGENNLELHRCVNVISAIERLNGEHIDGGYIDYLIFLVSQNLLEDFLANIDKVIYTTPTGRSIKAKTLGQKFYLNSLQRSDLTICTGPAGSGKTFLAVVMAVKALKNKEVSRIIITRPAIEAGERLGFLPGDMKEKVDPYMRPVFDALTICLGNEMFDRYYEKEVIEVSPLAFMRGRNLDDAFVILDEAQNTTPEQMQMFLTRIGINTKVCVCGDMTQTDLSLNIKSGLEDAIKVLKNIDEISIISLKSCDIVRNPLVKEIVKAYNKLTAKSEE